MAQIHTPVTLLTSHDLTWSPGRLTCQHASMRQLTDSHKEQCKNISTEFMAWFEAVGNKLLAHNVV
jgi:hypothetical protein